MLNLVKLPVIYRKYEVKDTDSESDFYDQALRNLNLIPSEDEFTDVTVITYVDRSIIVKPLLRPIIDENNRIINSQTLLEFGEANYRVRVELDMPVEEVIALLNV